MNLGLIEIGRAVAAKGFRVARFLLSGVPAFALAVPLNWLLVERGHVWKPGAYAIVMAVQLIINFFMCRYVVFRKQDRRAWPAQVAPFVFGFLGFRVADWLLYTLCTQVLGMYYLAAQFANVAVFALVKFEYARWVMERERPTPVPIEGRTDA
jgi:putative flippase GtrA